MKLGSSTTLTTNSVFTYNTANYGAGLSLESVTYVTDVSAVNNTGRTWGGFAYFRDSSIHFDGLLCEGNTVAVGGCLYANTDDDWTLTSSHLRHNTPTSSQGGAITHYDVAHATLDGVVIEYNSAGATGGVYVGSASSGLSMSNCVVRGNSGADASVYTRAVTSVVNCEFDAAIGSYAIYADDVLSMNNVSFTNFAAGALYTDTDAGVTATNAYFSNNQLAVYFYRSGSAGTYTLTDSVFEGNYGDVGAALRVSNGKLVTERTCFANNTQSANHTALYFENGVMWGHVVVHYPQRWRRLLFRWLAHCVKWHLRN